MQTSGQLNIFNNVKDSTNTINDNSSVISYVEIFVLINDLANSIDEIKKQNLKCIYVTPHNDVYSIIVILALLINKINFYLEYSNATTLSHSHFKNFCDGTINMDSNQFAMLSVTKKLNWVRNNSPLELTKLIKANSGAVFFSTSGTTGIKKFIYYKSEKLIKNAVKCLERFKTNNETKILIPVPINHMYGLGAGLLPGILSGSNICIINNVNVIKLYDKIKVFRPDLTLLTPAICRMLNILNKDISQKSLYITAGDKMSECASKLFEEKFGRLVNLYGCTELGAVATSDLAGTANSGDRGMLKPLVDVQVEIKNRKGEILCKHNACFESYLSELGTEIPSFESGWYSTKDIGLLSQNSSFKVIGRIDNCINRYGFLVSIEELESQIEELIQEINQVVLIVSENETKIEKELIAVCELHHNSNTNVNELNSICKKNIKKHLRPDRFLIVSKLPRLNNGKPDRCFLEKQYRLL